MYISALLSILTAGNLSAAGSQISDTSLKDFANSWERGVFNIPIENFPQIITVEQYDVLEKHSCYFEPKPVVFEGFPAMKFFYRGEISGIDFDNNLPKSHFKLFTSSSDSNNITVFEENGLLSFKLYYDVILKQESGPIEGFKKYGRPYHIKIYGKIIKPIEFLGNYSLNY